MPIRLAAVLAVALACSCGEGDDPQPPEQNDVFVPSVWPPGGPSALRVTSLAALQQAIDAAQPGQVVELADGTYINGMLQLRTNQVVVQGQTPGGVHLTGAIHVVVSGQGNVLRGLQFHDGNIGEDTLIDVTGSDNTLSQLSIDGFTARRYVHVDGGTHRNTLSHCNLSRKPAKPIGPAIQVTTSATVPGYHRIRFCALRNFAGGGGDYGNEPIRIGLGEQRANAARTAVEHCRFSRLGRGDSESISLKSSQNVCRFNTFSDNPDSGLVFRAGNHNVAYGNFFVNGAGGVRLKEGHGHVLYQNYFETGQSDAVRLQFVATDPLTNIWFVHNTFVNMGAISLGGTGPEGVVFANNLLDRPTDFLFSDVGVGVSWVGNLYRGQSGIPAAAGLTAANPQLHPHPHGYLVPAPGSPAVDAAASEYGPLWDVPEVDDDPSLTADIAGQARPAAANKKDVGCWEVAASAAPAAPRRPLVASDVGPVYLGGPAVEPQP